ncbi:biotin--[acetyl-CoA-carboxylase] ligase [Corticibacterium sp. UT-5YL-CI-8]|nr:biotin--[acetyl-CoA-carboxylase] ligase [Tianweitania sp. UT-5YL-CI-8]
MSFRLAPHAASAGFQLEAHDVVGSTNALALDRAREGHPGNLWVVSRKQDGGRGRRGRPWATLEGNLAATLLKVLHKDLSHAATLGFVAGLSLSEALDAVAPNARISIGPDGGGGGNVRRFELKWPNDVLASGSKMAGILLESTMLPGGSLAIAIGIGVNVAAYPEDVPYPATSLAALGSRADAEMLFLALSDAWTDIERVWDGGRGLSAIRDRWLQRAAGLGREVAVQLEGNIVRGIFETIDQDCRFVIRDAQGETIKIAAGDVHFGAVASAGSS